MLSENSKWYALYTRPRWEKKVAELLTRKNVEAYCPVNKVKRQWSDRKKTVDVPLFNSYVFVRVAEKQLLSVKSTDGVVNCVYWLGKPAVIKDMEIDVIKRFLNDYSNVQLEKTQVNINDRIRVTNGPFMLREGNVVEVMNKSVKVSLPSLGYALIAEIDKTHVEKISFLHRLEQPASEQFKISS
jgi:transcription antitermination factor NusG